MIKNISTRFMGKNIITVHRQSGFTLIELVIVLAVLGALAAIAVPQLTGLQEDAELAGTATTVSSEIGNQFAQALADGDASAWDSADNICGSGSGFGGAYNPTIETDKFSISGSEPSSTDRSVRTVTVPIYNGTSNQVESVDCYLWMQ